MRGDGVSFVGFNYEGINEGLSARAHPHPTDYLNAKLSLN